MEQKEKRMDVWSLVIIALAAVGGAFLRFIISDPKILFVLAMVVMVVLLFCLAGYAGAAFRVGRIALPKSVAYLHCLRRYSSFRVVYSYNSFSQLV